MKMEFANDPQFIEAMQADLELKKLRQQMVLKIAKYKYSYNFTWCGRPIIQLPDDMITLQEIVWEVQPDLIVETGIAHGGSLIYYASMLEIMGGDRFALGIDIDIREHNRVAIEQHPMFKRIKMIQGSSVDKEVMRKVYEIASGKKRVMVALDSNHSHGHVLEELELYSPLVKKGSYVIVFDTIVEDMPEYFFPDRPWGKGNNPKTAVWKFLETNDRFVIDKDVENKLLFTVAPDGYLKCIRD